MNTRKIYKAKFYTCFFKTFIWPPTAVAPDSVPTMKISHVSEANSFTTWIYSCIWAKDTDGLWDIPLVSQRVYGFKRHQLLGVWFDMMFPNLKILPQFISWYKSLWVKQHTWEPFVKSLPIILVHILICCAFIQISKHFSSTCGVRDESEEDRIWQILHETHKSSGETGNNVIAESGKCHRRVWSQGFKLSIRSGLHENEQKWTPLFESKTNGGHPGRWLFCLTKPLNGFLGWDLCTDWAAALHNYRGIIPLLAFAIGTPLSTIQVVFFVNGIPWNCVTQ